MLKAYVQCLINTYKRKINQIKKYSHYDSTEFNTLTKVVDDLEDLLKYIDSCESEKAVVLKIDNTDCREVINNIRKSCRRQLNIP